MEYFVCSTTCSVESTPEDTIKIVELMCNATKVEVMEKRNSII